MYCHILRVRAIPTLESTDSMIHIVLTAIWLNTNEEDLDYSVVVHALTNTVLPYVLEMFGIWLVLLASADD